MADYTIYHNPRCSKSRQTLQILTDKGVEPEIIAYLETPPSATELKQLIVKLGISPRQLLRKGEDAYKALGLADTGKSDAELIAAMAAEPKLIERPIVVKATRAVLGRPPENVLALID
ncbi:arsenate reductase (glutaredoxin) [Zhongshania sp.]|uniref:arsenate reductase (glutaredoxin) n=1 Tax=Zhongshania sp. TaxID=1971902 RepID=UPI00356669BA